jgi:hypothetical protein
MPYRGQALPVGKVWGAGAVGYYRLYLVNPVNGRFVGFEEIEAPDDVQAVHMAGHYSGSQALELWCGKRKVKSFPVNQASNEDRSPA